MSSTAARNSLPMAFMTVVTRSSGPLSDAVNTSDWLGVRTSRAFFSCSAVMAGSTVLPAGVSTRGEVSSAGADAASWSMAGFSPVGEVPCSVTCIVMVSDVVCSGLLVS